jgi:septum formation protein
VRQIVLASTSRYRAEVLARLQVPFDQAAPVCDEEAVARTEPIPSRLVWELARMKAASLSETFPEALIIGGDQLAVLGCEVLGKPGTEEAAVEQLMRLSGKVHRLLTAIAVHDARSGVSAMSLDVHHMWMRAFDRPEAERYVVRDLPLDCAGSYRIEGAGPTLLQRVDGDDPTSIMGLPLGRLASLLRRFEIEV